MRRLAVLASVALVAARAGAETPLRVRGQALADLFWTAAADCDARADDLQRRQCRAVRVARLGLHTGRTYVAPVDDGAIWVGDRDAARDGIPYGLRGCLACVHPVR